MLLSKLSDIDPTPGPALCRSIGKEAESMGAALASLDGKESGLTTGDHTQPRQLSGGGERTEELENLHVYLVCLG